VASRSRAACQDAAPLDVPAVISWLLLAPVSVDG